MEEEEAATRAAAAAAMALVEGAPPTAGLGVEKGVVEEEEGGAAALPALLPAPPPLWCAAVSCVPVGHADAALTLMTNAGSCFCVACTKVMEAEVTWAERITAGGPVMTLMERLDDSDLPFEVPIAHYHRLHSGQYRHERVMTTGGATG